MFGFGLGSLWQLVTEPIVTAADAIDEAYNELSNGASATIDDLTDITTTVAGPIPLVNVVAYYLGEEIDFQSDNALELTAEYVNFKDDTINVLQALGVGVLDFDKALANASLTQEGVLIEDTLVATFDAVFDVFEGIFTAA